MVCVHTCITGFQCKMVKKVLRNIALRSLVSSFILSTKTKLQIGMICCPRHRNVIMNTGTFPKESKSNIAMCKELCMGGGSSGG